MGKAIAITNQKGGVGKTTTAINLSACLAEKGKRVLTIDIDPQGNTTSGLGIDKEELEYSVYELLIGECTIEDCMKESIVKNLYVLPSNVNLAGAEIELIGVEEKEYILKQRVEPMKEFFDYIIIDCPPSLNTLTVNAMTTADAVLVPIQCEYYALEGLSQLIHTINLVKERLNASLDIEGVVFTMYDARTNLSLQVVENVRKNLEQKIYNSIIPRNVRLAEAPSHGLPISMYDPKSAGADAYRELADEVLRQDGFEVESNGKENDGSVAQSGKKGSSTKGNEKKKSKGFFGRRKEE
jgi:chromosome partitioning protein